MKRILFDLTASQPNSTGEFHGGGKYAKKVFIELVKADDVVLNDLICVYDSKRKLDTDIKKVIENANILLIDAQELSTDEIIKKQRIEKIYSALPDKQFFDFSQTKACEVITTIHGLRLIETKQPIESVSYETGIDKIKTFIRVLLRDYLTVRGSKYYKLLLDNTKVVVVSNHTKYSLLAYYKNVDPNRVFVFYSPDVTYQPQENVSAALQTSINYTDYFLIVSGKRWVKNTVRSIIALDETFTDHPELNKKVIITGISDPAVLRDKLKNKDKFIFLHYVSEIDLFNLYKNAYALLYMSLNEGFGYPPLEAMSLGIPVIASPFTSITEICGEAAMYANPYSVKEIKNRILWLLFDKCKYDELATLSLKQFEKISAKQKNDLNALIKFIIE